MGSISPEILSTRISRLQWLEEEYSDALEQFANSRSLEHAGCWLYVGHSPDMELHLQSTKSLCQDLFDRRQEVAETIEPAEAQLKGSRRLGKGVGGRTK